MDGRSSSDFRGEWATKSLSLEDDGTATNLVSLISGVARFSWTNNQPGLPGRFNSLGKSLEYVEILILRVLLPCNNFGDFMPAKAKLTQYARLGIYA